MGTSAQPLLQPIPADLDRAAAARPAAGPLPDPTGRGCRVRRRIRGLIAARPRAGRALHDARARGRNRIIHA